MRSIPEAAVVNAAAVAPSPTPKQRRVLLNVREGRPALEGFDSARSASAVLGNVIEFGWLVHSMKTTGPAFLLTPEGAAALDRT